MDLGSNRVNLASTSLDLRLTPKEPDPNPIKSRATCTAEGMMTLSFIVLSCLYSADYDGATRTDKLTVGYVCVSEGSRFLIRVSDIR